MSQPAKEKQPILRAPAVVLGLLAVLLGFHLLSVFGGNALRIELIVALGLFPARFFAEGLGGLPGGWVQGVVNLFSHSLLHARVKSTNSPNAEKPGVRTRPQERTVSIQSLIKLWSWNNQAGIGVLRSFLLLRLDLDLRVNLTSTGL